MQPLHFSLNFSGIVLPNGGDIEANDIAMTREDLLGNLDHAISVITGNGLVTGDTPGTLEEHSVQTYVSNAPCSTLVMPVISTAHLDADTAAALAEDPQRCRWATVASYGEGFFLRFFDENPDELMPACAKAIRQWVQVQGWDGWVRLDRDWDVVDGLASYDW